MDRGRRAAGILLIILSIVMLISWEKWGRSRFLYDEVLVLKEDAARGTLITEEMVTSRKMEGAPRGSLGPDDLAVLIGKEALQTIHGGIPLFKSDFESPGLYPDEEEGKMILRIPAHMISSLPAGLQKGDTVYLYAEGKALSEARVYGADHERGEVELLAGDEVLKAVSRLASGSGILVLSYN